MTKEELIETVYRAFNDREIDTVLTFFHSEVEWPNGWEGGHVYGHEKVRDYWQRQWKELNPKVTPMKMIESSNGNMEVEVKQVVKKTDGELLSDGIVYHTYQFENGLIKRMEIRN